MNMLSILLHNHMQLAIYMYTYTCTYNYNTRLWMEQVIRAWLVCNER